MFTKINFVIIYVLWVLFSPYRSLQITIDPTFNSTAQSSSSTPIFQNLNDTFLNITNSSNPETYFRVQITNPQNFSNISFSLTLSSVAILKNVSISPFSGPNIPVFFSQNAISITGPSGRLILSGLNISATGGTLAGLFQLSKGGILIIKVVCYLFIYLKIILKKELHLYI